MLRQLVHTPGLTLQNISVSILAQHHCNLVVLNIKIIQIPTELSIFVTSYITEPSIKFILDCTWCGTIQATCH